MSGADMSGAKNIPNAVLAQTSILPEGEIIGWKKLDGGLIAKLLVSSETRRSNATGRKCRCEEANVLAIYDGDKGVQEGKSQFDSGFIYRVGETVRCKEPFCEDRFEECASGIHFFITRAEAENY